MDFEQQRHNMVEGQIRPNKVTDEAVIAAIQKTPRELFVPKTRRGIAYSDAPLKAGEGRYLMPPMVIARLLDALTIEPDNVALVIGAGSGYEAALLGRLADAVVVVDNNPTLVAQVTNRLAAVDLDAVAVVEGDMTAGLPRQGPFDVILFNGAVAEAPRAILDQLADGGRAVAVVRHVGVGRATLFTRIGDTITKIEVFDANTPPLPGFEPKSTFVF